MKKIIFVIIFLSIVVLGFIEVYFYRVDSESNYIDKNKVIITYTNNKDIFNEISNYALENPENISIEKKEMTNANIDNKKIKNDCLYLSKKIGYRYIVEDNYTIQFIKQSDLRWGQGILYLKNNDKISKLQFIKDLEHIEGNWYYFEAQEWRNYYRYRLASNLASAL